MQQAKKKFATGYAAPATKTAVVKKHPAVASTPAPISNDLDHFAIDEAGNRFAGRHVIMDVMEASPQALSDAEHIRSMLKVAAEEAGATLLGMDIHHFPGGGVTGVAILAESHISIHTWPERGFAAIDVFMCGEALPGKCLPVVRRYLTPKFIQLTELKRGCLFDAAEAN